MIDCSKVAMLYGGGGHKGAAGFNTKEYVLEKGDWLYETNIDRKEYQTDR